MATQRQLFELAGANGRRFSPYCWRTRMALAHKGLDVETVPCRFLDIPERVAFANHDRVPVLKDGDTALGDSWTIACYLEEGYPARPTLFGDAGGRRYAQFFNGWVDGTVHAPLAAAIAPDILAVLDPDDRDYFRTTRERRWGKSFEALKADQGANVSRFRDLLKPARDLLSNAPYLGGPAPLYPDYTLFGTLQWARCTSPVAILEADDPLSTWFEAMLDLHDAAGRSAPAAA